MIPVALKPNNKLRQDLLQVTYDKLAGVQLPESTPGSTTFQDVMEREIDRAYMWVCNRIKTSLHPVRSTDLPKTSQEAYEDRIRWTNYIDALFIDFPQWGQLLPAQQALYNDDPSLYSNGSISWAYLTAEQRLLWSTKVKYAPNKVSDVEKQDGRHTAYIKLYRHPITEFHGLALSFVNVPGYQNLTTFFRLYKKNEVLVYEKEGAIHIFPAVMARLLNTNADPLYGSQYGVVAPRIPQVLHIDYTWGYEEAPADLLEAVGIKAAIQLLNYISALITGGLSGYGVQGFNAQFQSGMLYMPLKQQYEADLRQILRPYYQPAMTGW